MLYDSMQILEGSKVINSTVESGTTFPVSPVEGQLFFRSDTGKMHIYDGTTWDEVARAASAASLVPRISSVDVTNSSYIPTGESYVNTAGGYIKISGAAFVSGCSVLIDLAPATAVTFVGPEELRVQVPAKSTGNYSLFVVNPDGGTAIFVPGISYDPSPVWSTGSTLTTAYRGMSYSVQLSATENSTIIYSLATGSSLPSGITLSSSGLLSGVAPEVASNTNYSFTILATDDENQSTSRTFTLTVSTSLPVDYLVVAGGGAGGERHGGGGGGGGYVASSSIFAPANYTITVGDGGQPNKWDPNLGFSGTGFGGNGGNSSINSIVAVGGGGGGTYLVDGIGGGSGGGGGGNAGTTAANPGGGGTTNQGFAGGTGFGSSGGGGGGAGAAGTSAPQSTGGGNGGVGKQWLNGLFYAGGGGGGRTTVATPGGNGGGGDGGDGSTSGGAGANGRGGGGGGSRGSGTLPFGGTGGSGTVIIRYPGSQRATGGAVTSSGGYTYHTFTSSGTFTVNA